MAAVKIYLCLFVAITYHCVTAQTDDEEPTCGENEKYTTCGTRCQPTCANPNPVCDKRCYFGCECVEGYIRSERYGPCIKQTRCKEQQRCGENEEFLACGGCDQHCGQNQTVCTLECRPGCACRPGYVRDSRNRCVPEDKCAN